MDWHRDLNAGLHVCLMELKNNKEWIHCVGAVTHTHNTTYHASLGMSPFYCAYGSEPVNSMIDYTKQLGLATTTAERLVDTVMTAQKKAQKQLTLQAQQYEKTLAKRSKLFDPKTGQFLHNKKAIIKAGDNVLLRTDRWKVMSKQRLQPRVLGPFEVEKVEGKAVWLMNSDQYYFDRRVDADDLVCIRSLSSNMVLNQCSWIRCTRLTRSLSLPRLLLTRLSSLTLMVSQSECKVAVDGGVLILI